MAVTLDSEQCTRSNAFIQYRNYSHLRFPDCPNDVTPTSLSSTTSQHTSRTSVNPYPTEPHSPHLIFPQSPCPHLATSRDATAPPKPDPPHPRLHSHLVVHRPNERHDPCLRHRRHLPPNLRHADARGTAFGECRAPPWRAGYCCLCGQWGGEGG